MSVCLFGLILLHCALPDGWTRGGSHPARYEMGLDEDKCRNSDSTAAAYIRSTCSCDSVKVLTFFSSFAITQRATWIWYCLSTILPKALAWEEGKANGPPLLESGRRRIVDRNVGESRPCHQEKHSAYLPPRQYGRQKAYRIERGTSQKFST
jgi:hypothetical protein